LPDLLGFATNVITQWHVIIVAFIVEEAVIALHALEDALTANEFELSGGRWRVRDGQITQLEPHELLFWKVA
jgi:hypothetical protein